MIFILLSILTSLRLSLGGGYGWLTGEHGMVIDNIVQVGPISLYPFIPKQIAAYPGYSRRPNSHCHCRLSPRPLLGLTRRWN